MTRAKTRALLSASATVTAATVAVNLLSYGLVAVGTRSLGPQRYGELAALLGLLAVGVVPAGTLQVIVARRVAAGVAGGLTGAAVRVSVAVTVLAAALIPVLHSVLHISVPALVFLALALGPITLVGAPTGAAQGLHQFGRLAAVVTIAGLGRVGGGLAGLAIGGTVASTTAGMAAGAWLALAAGAAAVRGPAWHVLTAAGPVRAPVLELVHATVTMLALVGIMTVDVLLANRLLPAEQAGLYGAGAVITKVALWLPYAVTMIALPRLAVATHRRVALRVSVLVLAVLGVVEVAGMLVLGPVLFPIAVGKAYGGVVGWLWLFTAAGAILAITQLAVLSRIAATDRLVAPLLWIALLIEVVVVSTLPPSIGTIITASVVTAAVVALAALLVPLRGTPGGTRGEEPELALGSVMP
jgi:O-antigen/teichoic acid export membrane protein